MHLLLARVFSFKAHSELSDRGEVIVEGLRDLLLGDGEGHSPFFFLDRELFPVSHS